jgi:hypothetical protein
VPISFGRSEAPTRGSPDGDPHLDEPSWWRNTAETVDDVSMTYRDYLAERERLLFSLAPSFPAIG